ncbi:TIR domain-containing protein [Leptospira alexanderi]|uniref:TIR domain-containing protein n=1 Tax=Leptospira alexanderi TaxID=100053 RepID=UPI000991050B|nr:TIR domain-containing protein [Leptospira alexanderi]
MARKVFYSFHYKPDNWRVSQVRNIGSIEGNQPAKDNDWETITKAGDKKIQKWIDDQLYGRSCTIVLIGANTSERKWINYEIKKTWDSNKGILGIYIHNLKGSDGNKSSQGANPFAAFTINEGKTNLSSVVKAYNPPYLDSKEVYNYISSNISDWIDEAIIIRNAN